MYPGVSIESLKRRVLTVSKVANTAILELSATLGSAEKAQAIAQYIAEQTVELNGSLDAHASEVMTEEFRAQMATARMRREITQHALEEFARTQPVQTLDGDFQDVQSLKFRVERDLEAARTDLADYSAQQSHDAEEEEWVRNHVAATRARVDELAGRARELTDLLAKKGPELEERRVREDALERDEKSAEASFEAAATRLNEALSAAPFRGERLQIIDPGFVSQQPSSPDILLNVIAALVFSAVGSIIYLALSFRRSRQLRAKPERIYSHGIR
jgi:capsule polysaccharide export protein KpsE/RkpR